MAWWVPLAIAAAQMAKGEYDKQQASKSGGSSSSPTYSGGFNMPEFDASKYMQGDSSVVREPETVQAPPSARTPYYQPTIGGNIDDRLRDLRLLEASRGSQAMPMPTEPTLAPPYFQGDNSIIRQPNRRY